MFDVKPNNILASMADVTIKAEDDNFKLAQKIQSLADACDDIFSTKFAGNDREAEILVGFENLPILQIPIWIHNTMQDKGSVLPCQLYGELAGEINNALKSGDSLEDYTLIGSIIKNGLGKSVLNCLESDLKILKRVTKARSIIPAKTFDKFCNLFYRAVKSGKGAVENDKLYRLLNNPYLRQSLLAYLVALAWTGKTSESALKWKETLNDLIQKLSNKEPVSELLSPDGKFDFSAEPNKNEVYVNRVIKKYYRV